MRVSFSFNAGKVKAVVYITTWNAKDEAKKQITPRISRLIAALAAFVALFKR